VRSGPAAGQRDGPVHCHRRKRGAHRHLRPRLLGDLSESRRIRGRHSRQWRLQLRSVDRRRRCGAGSGGPAHHERRRRLQRDRQPDRNHQHDRRCRSDQPDREARRTSMFLRHFAGHPALAVTILLMAACSTNAGGGGGGLAPVITSFTSDAATVAPGQSTTLRWSVTNAISVSIDHGVGLVSGTSMVVTPVDTTTYTLTATGPGGRATQSVSVSVHTPFLHLQYDDPPVGAGKLRLVRNASSTATHLVLDLQVGGNPVTGFGIALSLPVDAAKVTFTPASGLVVNATTLDAGSAPATAAATLPLTGPLGNMLVVGVARKKQVVTDGDVLLPAGATV